MTVDRVSQSEPARVAASEIVMDGLFTGMIGALAVALWFLIVDLLNGRALYTPALLGTMLLHGGKAVAAGVSVAPLEIAAYTAFHFVAFIAVGVGLSWLMSLFERFPIMFFVIVVLAVCLQLGFFGLTMALGLEGLGRLQLWAVVVANLLAAGGMAAYQWRRHPGAIRRIETLWEHTD